ncbi:MAG: cysteine desulfurase family protein [Candidatus Paceibacterota bacterium]|jgi:cysteine desulfurase
MKRIYLDYAATTPVDPRVMKAMLPYFTEKFANPMSLHSFGQEAKLALEESRKKIADFMGALPKEIIFTSSATESNNLALKGIISAYKGKHIIISPIEHPCVAETGEWLEKQGVLLDRLKVDKYGLIDLEDLKNKITKDTVLVSVIHASNEIGTVQPIEKIGKICKEKGVLFHTDASQSFGKMPFNLKKMDIDLLTASSHKMYGPKGIALLYVRDGVKIDPILHGGGQERGLRSSTSNVPSIVGFAKACEIAKKEMRRDNLRIGKLRDKLISRILKDIPGSHLNGHPAKRLVNNANVRFDFIEGESIIVQLDLLGIAASTGSACSSAKLEPSHVLMATGLKHQEAHGSLRISLGKWTRESEINYLLKVLPSVVGKLRRISPFKKSFKF